jgi:hypothetical protein
MYLWNVPSAPVLFPRIDDQDAQRDFAGDLTDRPVF